MKPKVILGLSGGVDSAVAATLLQADYDLTCVFLDVGIGTGGDDAAALAQQLGLPFRRVDIRAELEHHICQNFVEEYLKGNTPLPCARCNPLVKFPALAKVAEEIGADYLATGHYARTALAPNGRTLLQRGTGRNDQSYLLARLPQNLLSRILFPLGGYEKTKVRAMASSLDLVVAKKPDSMELCFIPDDDYTGWLDARGDMPPSGDFVDPQGQILGIHRGIHHYTLGQGRGLGVAGPHRYFVSAIDPQTNRVTLSDGSDLMAHRVWCSEPNWIAVPHWEAPLDVTVRVRHSKVEVPALVYQNGDEVLVELKQPIRAPTPGQLAVFYQGETVVGSSWIERAEFL